MGSIQILAELNFINVLIAGALGLFLLLFGFVLNRPPDTKDKSELQQWKRDLPLQWIFLVVIIVVTVILVSER